MKIYILSICLQFPAAALSSSATEDRKRMARIRALKKMTELYDIAERAYEVVEEMQTLPRKHFTRDKNMELQDVKMKMSDLNLKRNPKSSSLFLMPKNLGILKEPKERDIKRERCNQVLKGINYSKTDWRKMGKKIRFHEESEPDRQGDKKNANVNCNQLKSEAQDRAGQKTKSRREAVQKPSYALLVDRCRPESKALAVTTCHGLELIGVS